MFIKIDIREAELIESCNFLLNTMQCFSNLKIVTESLPIGDIIICSDLKNDAQNDERVIIERKSLRDLSASIKDGRYEEQSYRLNGIPHHNHNIVYLIEGTMEKYNIFKGNNDKMMLYSAMVSINYYKGFSLWRSSSISESALIICNCAYKLAKGEKENKRPFYKYIEPISLSAGSSCSSVSSFNKENSNLVEGITDENNIIVEQTTNDITGNLEIKEENEKDYCSVIKKVKKENITPGNIGEIMLCQIPSISSVTAIAILAEHKTLPNLLNNLKNDQTCLKNISYKTPTGQVRKISKACIENIIKFLM